MNARQLQAYVVEQALQHQNDIAPELMSYVGGDSKVAIDASIEMAKRKSAELLARAQQELARPADVDPEWAAGNREALGDQQLCDQVQSWTLAEFAKHRAELGLHKTTIDFLSGS